MDSHKEIAESILRLSSFFPETKGYFNNLSKNLLVSFKLWKASSLSFCHALLPFLFKKSGNDLMRDIYYENLIKELHKKPKIITQKDILEASHR